MLLNQHFWSVEGKCYAMNIWKAYVLTTQSDSDENNKVGVGVIWMFNVETLHN